LESSIFFIYHTTDKEHAAYASEAGVA
jgi:hypothetical protein